MHLLVWDLREQDGVHSEDDSVCDEAVDAGAGGDAYRSSNAAGVGSTLDVDRLTRSTDPLDVKSGTSTTCTGAGVGAGTGGGATLVWDTFFAIDMRSGIC